jgi:hypothetical protein
MNWQPAMQGMLNKMVWNNATVLGGSYRLFLIWQRRKVLREMDDESRDEPG